MTKLKGNDFNSVSIHFFFFLLHEISVSLPSPAVCTRALKDPPHSDHFQPSTSCTCDSQRTLLCECESHTQPCPMHLCVCVFVRASVRVWGGGVCFTQYCTAVPDTAVCRCLLRRQRGGSLRVEWEEEGGVAPHPITASRSAACLQKNSRLAKPGRVSSFLRVKLR